MSQSPGGADSSAPWSPAAARFFGQRVSIAQEYADVLVHGGVERGVIGPKEADRLWERHLLNSAAVSELIPNNARVIDVGSGAGLPGIPLLIARPDLRMTLLESMSRRVNWLNEVVDRLRLAATVVRGRAEDRQVVRSLSGADVVVGRAVAPLGKLTQWCLPLLRPGGYLMALKGASALEELERDRVVIERAGGAEGYVTSCGDAFLETPTTVIVVRKNRSPRERDREPRAREDQFRASRLADRSNGCST